MNPKVNQEKILQFLQQKLGESKTIQILLVFWTCDFGSEKSTFKPKDMSKIFEKLMLARKTLKYPFESKK